MMITKQDIADYLDARRQAWAPSTLQSEAARLHAVLNVLATGDPASLWAAFDARRYQAYTRVTTWIRVCGLVDWLISAGRLQRNEYKAWRAVNGRLFKNAYTRRTPDIDFATAEKRCEGLRPDVRRRALEILRSGLRWRESCAHANGQVVGKGSKARDVFVPADIAGPEYKLSYSTFLRQLKTVGLMPHDLRKLALSRLVELGANEFELTAIAGWSSLAPALSYIRKDKQKLKKLMQGLNSNELRK